MAERVAPALPDEAGANNIGSTSEEFDELRSLLIGPELNQISRLRERLDDPARFAGDVSRVLPQAVKLSTDRDERLTGALMPSVEEAISVSVKKNPKRLADAISPVMGPAIRRYINKAFREMVQSLNQTLEYSLSLKGLKWRLEALHARKKFAEVVLSHTLLYRVEQVLLIYKETGLVLQHVEADSVAAKDADLVSSMLTAIQDWVRDSFGKTGEDSSIQIEGFTVWVENGPQAAIAAVIEGDAPVELRNDLMDALDSIHVEQRSALESFDGDTDQFKSSRHHLEACLRMQTADAEKKSSTFFWVLTSLALLAIGVWLYFYILQTWRWNNYLERLKSEPGIILVSSERSGGKYRISGLRDPLARDPVVLLNGTGIEPHEVVGRWEAFQSSGESFVLTRANALLQPPSTVNLRVEDGILVAEGNAPEQWIAESRRLAQALPSIYGYKDENLIDRDRVVKEIERLQQQIEGRTIQFAVGSSELAPDQESLIDSLASDIKRLGAIVPSIGKTLRIETSGHTDKSGTENINKRLGQERAQTLASALSSKGIETSNPTPSPSDSAAPDPQAKEFGREARVRVNLFDRGAPTR